MPEGVASHRPRDHVSANRFRLPVPVAASASRYRQFPNSSITAARLLPGHPSIFSVSLSLSLPCCNRSHRAVEDYRVVSRNTNSFIIRSRYRVETQLQSEHTNIHIDCVQVLYSTQHKIGDFMQR